MQNEIAVNNTSLGSDISTLQSQLNLIKGNINKMYQAVSVLDTMWDGPANEAFKQQFAKDQTDMEALCGTVQRILDCMTYAKDQYNTCENEISGIIASIRV